MPEDEYETNRNLYQELASLNPSNEAYKKRGSYYSEKYNIEIQRRQRIKKEFSNRDGSHIKLTKSIREALIYPSSFQHVRTTYVEGGDHLIVAVQFRFQSITGATIPDTLIAKVSLDGRILKIIEYSAPDAL